MKRLFERLYKCYLAYFVVVLLSIAVVSCSSTTATSKTSTTTATSKAVTSAPAPAANPAPTSNPAPAPAPGNAPPPPPPVAGVKTGPNTIELRPGGALNLPAGETKQLEAIYTAPDGSTSNVTSTATWTSDNPSVATVDAKGLVTAVSTGTANVWATFAAATSVKTPVIVG